MHMLLEIGNGETVITIGEVDCGCGLTQEEMNASVETLLSLEKHLDVSVNLLRERNSTHSKFVAEEKLGFMEVDNPKLQQQPSQNPTSNVSNKITREYFLRRNYENDDFIEVRVAVVGNVDSGKSTLLGVLTHSVLDDGRGHARTKLFRHKHEIESGRTSSVGNDILGFDCKGKIVNDLILNGAKNLDWETICKMSAKVKYLNFKI
jgi:GTPase